MVSIIIPTYNRSKLVKESIDSLLAQTYIDLEIHVVDDGSADDTQQTVTGIAQKDNRVKCYLRPYSSFGYMTPAAGDAGGALGAAQMAYYMYFEQKRIVTNSSDAMQGAYLGPDFSDKDAIIAFKKHKAIFSRFDNFNELCSEVADLLDKGNVVGWFQGRMEYGPRALGNRSILGDARNVEMQKKLNLKIKYREGFRPFATLYTKNRRAFIISRAKDTPADSIYKNRLQNNTFNAKNFPGGL
jgi:predicted NodU family carbamoyl transferase